MSKHNARFTGSSLVQELKVDECNDILGGFSVKFNPHMQSLRGLFDEGISIDGISLASYFGKVQDSLFEDSYSSTASTALPEAPKFLNHFSQPQLGKKTKAPITSKIDWNLKYQSKKLKTGSLSKCLDESKIDILNKHLEKKIYKMNQVMKPFDIDEEEDGAFGNSFLNLSS